MPFGAKIALSPTLDVQIEVAEGGNVMQSQINMIESVSFWQGLPTQCPMPGCGAPLVFFARHPQTFHYYGLKCTGPKVHEANFGERKDNASLYLKDDAWKDAYGGSDSSNEPAQAQSAPAQTQTAAASPTGDKVDAGTIRMIQAIANGKNPKPDVDGIAQQFFNNKLADLSKADALAVLDYLKTL